MHSFFRFSAIAAFCLNAATAFAVPSYTLVDLGDHAGYGSHAAAINSAGHIVGSSNYPMDPNWPRYTFSTPILHDGKLNDLKQGTMVSRATGINDHGHIVGYSSDPFGGARNGFRIANGVVTSFDGMAIRGINGNGHMIGSMHDANGRESAQLFDGVAWGGIPMPLAVDGSWTNAINKDGFVVGNYTMGPGISRGFLYGAGQFIDFSAVISGNSFVNDINGKGEVIGFMADADDHYSPFIYANGKVTDLGLLLGCYYCLANGVNDHGHIVGLYFGPTGSGGFLYADGQANKLSDLIVNDEDWVISEVLDINDRGQIVATGCSRTTGRCTGLRLDPNAFAVPEPVGLGLLGLAGGLASSAMCRRSRRQHATRALVDTNRFKQL